MLHYLLDIPSSARLQLHPIIGNSWEGYVIEQICQLLPHRVTPYFYRTQDGSEMDLVLVKGDKPIACIEIKTTDAPSVSRGMRESMADLACKHNFIIVSGNPKSFNIDKDLCILGLMDFLHHHLPKIVK
jgi:predicted AAA+ superfamily ATPase